MPRKHIIKIISTIIKTIYDYKFTSTPFFSSQFQKCYYVYHLREKYNCRIMSQDKPLHKENNYYTEVSTHHINLLGSEDVDDSRVVGRLLQLWKKLVVQHSQSVEQPQGVST